MVSFSGGERKYADPSKRKQSTGRDRRGIARRGSERASERYRGLDRNNVIIPETGDVCSDRSPGLSRLRRYDHRERHVGFEGARSRLGLEILDPPLSFSV